MAESNQPGWRELCAAAATEPDSERLADLVEQIIKALDAREAGVLSSNPFSSPGQPSSEKQQSDADLLAARKA